MALASPLQLHVTPSDFAWLQNHWASQAADEDALPPLFDEDTGDQEPSQDLEAKLLSLRPPKSLSTLPEHFSQSPACVALHDVGELRLATVEGGRIGHGDVLWGSALYAAELLEASSRCRSADQGESAVSRLLGGRSLQGLRVLELGAGLGLPSWVAMRRGARVVASDLRDPDRLGALAAAAALNAPSAGEVTGECGEAHVRAHSWGEPCDVLTSLFGGFDLILMCDILYITDLHEALLASTRACLAPGGVVLVAFALHHDHNEEAVFNFFELARAKGFKVEELEERQMPVRCSNMADKRFYVYARTLAVSSDK
eukprot:TRINITY_DN14152_c1_g4_i3.p1 TRINITY_DN14152_c1_g4~~TRINITY_DN14152_c1_g4_i3.p1  ORF type:complete len:314 (+),score=49.97 TRINITY_DN14152_c1_g4_i3:97-1038(+)